MTNSPRLFRLNIEVGEIDEALDFYSRLLEISGREQMGSRVYFDAGGVTLQVVQAEQPQTAPKALYFEVEDLDRAHERARELGCLSRDQVHGTPAGEPAVRPWGERSFYVDDPWGNPLCFVEGGTIYEG